MKKRILSGLALIVLAFILAAQIQPASASFTIPDPCNTQQRLSAPINVSTATTTNVVSALGGEGIYVCGQLLNVSTLTVTLKWEYGTTVTTPCDTGTTAITGVIATPGATPSAPWINAPTSAFLQFAVPAGNALCLVTTGSSPGVQGWITYVQG